LTGSPITIQTAI